jgi:hypothetical protein
LYSNTTGTLNTAVGTASLYSNTTGGSNVAVGRDSLRSNTTASNNTAVGYQAGYSQTTNGLNTYLGRLAGYSSTGIGNTFLGTNAGYSSTGSYNTFIGANNSGGGGSGQAMTTGSKNTIIGGFDGNMGGLDIRTSSNYIVLSDGDGTPRYGSNASGQSEFFGSNNVVGARTAAGAGTGDRIFFGVYGSSGIFGSGTISYTVWSNGNVVNTNNSYGAISDIKLKENITDATPKLEKLCQVRVVNYNFKEGQTQKQLGVIAQELEAVFPSMVEESPDKDAEGNDLGTVTKSVKYSVFVPMLIKAIQELKAEIDTLKGQA